MAVVQTLSGRYTDGEKLLQLLIIRFGRGNFSIQNSDDNYILTIPTYLSSADQRSVEK
ncbi:hypothetical protein F5Y12DRAFT_710742 [Xylaria sp. FL1777]|nr:hypothetical protein F5Y12DRAFT_710742 [Xylaria sp. FL1777]